MARPPWGADHGVLLSVDDERGDVEACKLPAAVSGGDRGGALAAVVGFVVGVALVGAAGDVGHELLVDGVSAAIREVAGVQLEVHDRSGAGANAGPVLIDDLVLTDDRSPLLVRLGVMGVCAARRRGARSWVRRQRFLPVLAR